MFDWFFRLLRFLHLMKPAHPTARSLEAVHSTASSEPIFLPVLREPPKLELDDHLTIEFINPSGEKRMFECGHEDYRYFEMSIYGRVLKPPTEVPPQFCRDCGLDMLKHEERCCLCGQEIGLGDPFILYPSAKSERTWHAAYIENDGERRYLGCLGWDCSDNACGGASYAGNLTDRGARLLYGGMSAIDHVAKTGEEVLVNF